MKKLNRKGFVLAEAIVVAVFVLGMFTYLAVNIIPLITKYDQALKYDNPQEVYAANILLDELHSAFLSDADYKHPLGFSFFEWVYLAPANHKIINFSYITNQTAVNYSFFQQLKTNLKIDSIAIIDLESTDTDKCSGLDRGMYEYCNYLKDRDALESDFGMTTFNYNNSSGENINCERKKFLIKYKFTNEKYANFSAIDCRLETDS